MILLEADASRDELHILNLQRYLQILRVYPYRSLLEVCWWEIGIFRPKQWLSGSRTNDIQYDGVNVGRSSARRSLPQCLFPIELPSWTLVSYLWGI